jgi:hypothetical protein
MNVHKNARLTRHGRERIVRQVERGKRRKPLPKPQGFARGLSASGSTDTAARAWTA